MQHVAIRALQHVCSDVNPYKYEAVPNSRSTTRTCFFYMCFFNVTRSLIAQSNKLGHIMNNWLKRLTSSGVPTTSIAFVFTYLLV